MRFQPLHNLVREQDPLLHRNHAVSDKVFLLLYGNPTNDSRLQRLAVSNCELSEDTHYMAKTSAFRPRFRLGDTSGAMYTRVDVLASTSTKAFASPKPQRCDLRFLIKMLEGLMSRCLIFNLWASASASSMHPNRGYIFLVRMGGNLSFLQRLRHVRQHEHAVRVQVFRNKGAFAMAESLHDCNLVLHLPRRYQ